MAPNQVSLGIEAPNMPSIKGTTITCPYNSSDITTAFASSIKSIVTHKNCASKHTVKAIMKDARPASDVINPIA
jgi:hypothetical protein